MRKRHAYFSVREIPLAGALVLCWLGPAGVAAASAQAADQSVMVVEVWGPAGDVDAAAIQEAIARELGVVAVSPWDPRAPSSRGTIRVRIDGGQLEVEYEERHTIRRHVAAPTDADAMQKTVAFLAGNLARHEASDIAIWLGQKSRAKPAAFTPSADVPSPEPAATPNPETEVRRIWIGASVEVDASTFDGNHYVVDADGIPVSFEPPGVPTGLGVNTRVLLDFDYATSDHTLFGARAGIMIRRYPGQMGTGVNIDRFHLEARATLFMGTIGSEWTPYLSAGVGAANFDAEQDAAPLEVWKSHGPVFVAAGFGVQIPLFRGVAAMATPIKLTLAFPNDTTLLWSPEVSMRVGF